VFARALRGQYDAERDGSVTTASLYRHFADAVWLSSRSRRSARRCGTVGTLLTVAPYRTP